MHQIVQHSRVGPGKSRCGDAVAVAGIDGGRTLALAAADGVSRSPRDWAASAEACERLMECLGDGPAGAADDPAARLEMAVRAAHAGVQGLAGEAAGSLTTLVCALWPQEGRRVWFAGVGDSRVYRVGGGAPQALTTDDTCSVPITRGGQVVLQDGAVVFGHGITMALGQAEPLEFTVDAVDLDPGDLLALVTDGCHEMPGFGNLLQGLQRWVDLEQAVQKLVFEQHASVGRDDGTLAALRLTGRPEGWRDACGRAALDHDVADLPGMPGHLLAAGLTELMREWAAIPDPARLQMGLDTLARRELHWDGRAPLEILQALRDDGAPETLALYRRLCALAGRV